MLWIAVKPWSATLEWIGAAYSSMLWIAVKPWSATLADSQAIDLLRKL